jgi:hypothetical protein
MVLKQCHGIDIIKSNNTFVTLKYCYDEKKRYHCQMLKNDLVHITYGGIILPYSTFYVAIPLPIRL